MTKLKQWMNKYAPSLAATLAGILVVAIGGAAAKCDITSMLGGVSKKEIKNAVQHSPVIAFETVRDGIKYNETTTPPGNIPQNQTENTKIQKSTELIPQGIYVNESCIILVTANSKCAVTGNKNNNTATVITTITIDGIEAAQDLAYGESEKTQNLYSSTVTMWELEPGMHRITAEGNFYGSTINHDTTMQYVLIRKGNKPLLNSKKTKT